MPGVREDDLDGDTHGGLVETSQLLALHPEWVERDYATLPRRTVDVWLEERGEAAADRARQAGRILAMVEGFKAGMRFFSGETYAGAPGGRVGGDRRADPRHARRAARPRRWARSSTARCRPSSGTRRSGSCASSS